MKRLSQDFFHPDDVLQAGEGRAVSEGKLARTTAPRVKLAAPRFAGVSAPSALSFAPSKVLLHHVFGAAKSSAAIASVTLGVRAPTELKRWAAAQWKAPKAARPTGESVRGLLRSIRKSLVDAG